MVQIKNNNKIERIDKLSPDEMLISYENRKSFYHKEFNDAHQILLFGLCALFDQNYGLKTEDALNRVDKSLRFYREVYSEENLHLLKKEDFRHLRPVTKLLKMIEENALYVVNNFKDKNLYEKCQEKISLIKDLAHKIPENTHKYREETNYLRAKLGMKDDIWHDI